MNNISCKTLDPNIIVLKLDNKTISKVSIKGTYTTYYLNMIYRK